MTEETPRDLGTRNDGWSDRTTNIIVGSLCAALICLVVLTLIGAYFQW